MTFVPHQTVCNRAAIEEEPQITEKQFFAIEESRHNGAM